MPGFVRPVPSGIMVFAMAVTPSLAPAAVAWPARRLALLLLLA